MNNFSAQSNQARCSRCNATQKPGTIYCAKCGTASLQGQSPLSALLIRAAIFYGMLLVCIAMGTVSGFFLLMIYLQRSAFPDQTLLLWSALAALATCFCIGVMFRLMKL